MDFFLMRISYATMDLSQIYATFLTLPRPCSWTQYIWACKEGGIRGAILALYFIEYSL
jgi:hypothetical protein